MLQADGPARRSRAAILRQQDAIASLLQVRGDARDVRPGGEAVEQDDGRARALADTWQQPRRQDGVARRYGNLPRRFLRQGKARQQRDAQRDHHSLHAIPVPCSAPRRECGAEAVQGLVT